MSPDSEALEAADDNPLQEHLMAAVSAFRVGRTAEGNTALIEFIDLMQRALQALGDEAIAALVLPHVQEIVAAQERGDVLCIADLLEFELLPAI